jgi:threonine/homoserine/homoserine lactone efflux protein
VLQFVNPKTWLATLALVSGYLQGRSLDLAETTAAVALFLAIVTMSMTVWTVFGASIRARTGPEQWRLVNRSLAVLAACTVVTFWV